MDACGLISDEMVATVDDPTSLAREQRDNPDGVVCTYTASSMERLAITISDVAPGAAQHPPAVQTRKVAVADREADVIGEGDGWCAVMLRYDAATLGVSINPAPDRRRAGGCDAYTRLIGTIAANADLAGKPPS